MVAKTTLDIKVIILIFIKTKKNFLIRKRSILFLSLILIERQK